MEVEIARRAGGLAIELRVDTPEAQRALEAERGALEDMLRGDEGRDGGASVSISLRERSGGDLDGGDRCAPDADSDADGAAAPRRFGRAI